MNDQWQEAIEQRLDEAAMHRRSLSIQMDAAVRRAEEQAESIDSIRGGLEENTKATKEIYKNTAEMLDLFQSWKGAMKVLEVLGKAAKPLAAILGLFVALAAWWGTLKGLFR